MDGGRKSSLKGFAIRFDRLGDFLSSQNIYLDEPSLMELGFRYTGNSLEMRSV